MARRIYEKMRFHLLPLRHFCWLSPDFDSEKWGGIRYRVPHSHQFGELDLSWPTPESLTKFWNADWDLQIPERSLNFLLNRYSAAPFYEYIFASAESDEENVLVVYRIQECELGLSIKVLDILHAGMQGDLANRLVQALLQIHNAEFADFYCAGSSSMVSRLSETLCKVASIQGLIIPNYFQPLELRNVDLMYAGNFCPNYVSRGDVDQDRPND
jgi:hypothetical protein